MKTKKTIVSGVGAYPNDVRLGNYRLEEALQFIEKHCTNPELYQDIRNTLQDVKYQSGYVPPVEKLCYNFSLGDVHRTLVVRITSGGRQSFTGWGQFVKDVFLRVTDDGMIADVIEEKPFMNAALPRALKII